MAIKLSPLTLRNRIAIWVLCKSHISSLPCANTLETCAESNPNPNPNPNPSNSPDFDRRIQFLRNKLDPDNLIRILDSTDDLSSAVRIFKWASSQNRFRHTKETYYHIALKLGLAGNSAEMEDLVRTLVRDKVPGSKEALSALIDEFITHCKLSEALSVLVCMNFAGFSLSISIINRLMSALVKEKRRFEDVLLVYKEMVKAGISPNVETLNCLLEALIESGRVETALGQFKRMPKKDCHPNSMSFEIIIGGLVAKNRVDEAVEILQGVFKSESNCNPDLSFFTCMIQLFSRENKPNELIKLFRSMKELDFVPDSATFEALIGCLCDNLQLDEAIEIVEEMIASGSSLPDTVTFGLIGLFCELGKVDEAEKFLNDKNIVETALYNIILKGCYRAGKFPFAFNVLRKMSELNVDDCDSWNIFIRWTCEQNRIRKANEFLCIMIVSSFIPDSATFSALIMGNCESGNYGTALELFRRIRENSWVLESASYCKLVEDLCNFGSVREASEVFWYMSKSEQSLQSSAFNTLIKATCNEGNLGEAIELRNLAYRFGLSCDSSTFSAIMRGLLKVGKSKSNYVLVVFSQMIVEGCNLDLEAYCVLIETMSLHNRIKDCVFLFNEMVDKDFVPDSEGLHGLLSEIADRQQLRGISGSVDKLICSEEVNSSIFNLLINGMWREGKESEARWFLDLMLEKGWVPDARTHRLLLGSVAGEEIISSCAVYGNSGAHDSVSDLLVEGLE